jgi:hypoxanthine phosphoribosyltransferase
MITVAIFTPEENTMPKKRVIITCSWDDFSHDIEALTERIRVAMRTRKFDGVFGIPRGGLVMAVCISDRLGLPFLGSATKNSIVVDDIADSGKTLQHYRDIGCFIATLFYHPDSLVKPDVWMLEKPRNTDAEEMWVVFPWEAP